MMARAVARRLNSAGHQVSAAAVRGRSPGNARRADV
jgi:hypothetical protein